MCSRAGLIRQLTSPRIGMQRRPSPDFSSPGTPEIQSRDSLIRWATLTASLGRAMKPWKDFSTSAVCQYQMAPALPNISYQWRLWIRLGPLELALTNLLKLHRPEASRRWSSQLKQAETSTRTF